MVLVLQVPPWSHSKRPFLQNFLHCTHSVSVLVCLSVCYLSVCVHVCPVCRILCLQTPDQVQKHSTLVNSVHACPGWASRAGVGGVWLENAAWTVPHWQVIGS